MHCPIMNNFSITPATEKELDWAAGLMASSEPWTTLGITPEQCFNDCHHKWNLVFIAHLIQVPCGMVILQDRGVAGSPYIKSIAVDPGYRNKGIGKALLQFAEDKYRPGSKHIFLCVSSFNKQAQKFYRENGYDVSGELKDYIVSGHSEILMHKRLH